MRRLYRIEYNTNSVGISAFFLTKLLNYYYGQYPVIYKDYLNVTIVATDFKQQFCPLVFNGSNIEYLKLIGLLDSFYQFYSILFNSILFYSFYSIDLHFWTDK